MLSRLRTNRSVTALLMSPLADRMPQILISRPPRKARPFRISNSRVGAGVAAVATLADSAKARMAAMRRIGRLPRPRQDGIHHHDLVLDAIAVLAVADRLPGGIVPELRADAGLDVVAARKPGGVRVLIEEERVPRSARVVLVQVDAPRGQRVLRQPSVVLRLDVG